MSVSFVVGVVALAVSALACAGDAQRARPEGDSGGAEMATGTPGETVREALWGTEWRLVDLAGTPVLDRPQATLAFPELGRAAGSGSCNRFAGSVEISGSSIRFGPLVSTKMACPGPVSMQEAEYLGALQAAERYTVDGDELLVHSRGIDEPLRFVRASP